MLSGMQVVVVLCLQFGDTAKGKIVEILAAFWADIILRNTGGPNAGHTFCVNGKKVITHLLPCGIQHSHVTNIIGPGVALDLIALDKEMQQLPELDFKNLKISHEVGLLMPFHVLEDLMSKRCQKIGTTGSGIGPFYADLAARFVFHLNDLMNPKIFKSKLQEYFEEKENYFKTWDKAKIKQLIADKKPELARFYDEEKVFNKEAITEYYLNYLGKKFRPYLFDIIPYMEQALADGKRIVFEGSQGALLDVTYGTTTFQTSGQVEIMGALRGTGIPFTKVDRVFGTAKAPNTTRVGNGPFVTEFGGPESEKHCSDKTHTEAWEKEHYHFNLDELLEKAEEKGIDFLFGILIRILGKEYGAKTGRPRRGGWLDEFALKYAININQAHLVLTKLDVMTGVKKLKICIGYTYMGEPMWLGDRYLHHRERLKNFTKFSEILYLCDPIYEELDGWTEDITQAHCLSDLPLNLLKYIDRLWKLTSTPIDMLSVGPDQLQTIVILSHFRLKMAIWRKKLHL